MPTDADLGLVLADAVRAGATVRVKAAGLSMGVRYSAADGVEIAPAARCSWGVGSVVVYERGGRWVAHRVVWRRRGGEAGLVLTKGDGVGAFDQPYVRDDELVGVVVAVWEQGRRRRTDGPAARLQGLAALAVGLARMAAGRVLLWLRRAGASG